jgi:hypothetical protein
MCKLCGNADCHADDYGEAPTVLVSRSANPEDLIALDPEAYRVRTATGSLASAVLGTLTDRFGSVEEAASAVGYADADELLKRLSDPALTVGEVSRLLALADKELGGIVIGDLGAERRRGEAQRRDRAETSAFDTLFARVRQTRGDLH